MSEKVISTVYNGAVPDDGPIAVFMSVPISAGARVQVDMRDLYNRGFISGVQAMYIDLNDVLSDVEITITDTQQRIVVKAGSQGYYPILSTTQYNFYFHCKYNATVKVHFLNFAIASGTWNDKGSNSGGGVIPDFPVYTAGTNIKFTAGGNGETVISADFPDYPKYKAGTNITFVTGADGEITINAAGGSGGSNLTIAAGTGIGLEELGNEVKIHTRITAGNNVTIDESDGELVINASGGGGGGSSSGTAYGGAAFAPVPNFYRSEQVSIWIGAGKTIKLPLSPDGYAVNWRPKIGNVSPAPYIVNQTYAGNRETIVFNTAKLVDVSGRVVKKFRVSGFVNQLTNFDISIGVWGTIADGYGSWYNVHRELSVKSGYFEVPAEMFSGSDGTYFWMYATNNTDKEVQLKYEYYLAVEYLGEA